MREFMPEPSLLLTTPKDTLFAIQNPEWMQWPHPKRYEVKSTWIISLINEITTSGKYPYNLDVQRLAEERLGLEKSPDSGCPISVLVYNAQAYRRSDKLTADGYQPLSNNLVAKAFADKSKLQFPGAEELCNVRQIDGKLYVMKPRKRRWGVGIHGQPVKIIPKEQYAKAKSS